MQILHPGVPECNFCTLAADSAWSQDANSAFRPACKFFLQESGVHFLPFSWVQILHSSGVQILHEILLTTLNY